MIIFNCGFSYKSSALKKWKKFSELNWLETWWYLAHCLDKGYLCKSGMSLLKWSLEITSSTFKRLNVFIVSETRGGVVKCLEKKCEPLICQVGFRSETVSTLSSAQDCCPDQVCIPVEPNPVIRCPELVKPDCGRFQQVKTVFNSSVSGCSKLVCGKFK